MSNARSGRARQSTLTLIGALGATLAIVAVIVFVTVRPSNTVRAEIDWHTVHASLPGSTLYVDPTFAPSDGDWWSNRAEYIGGDYPEWYIGLVTPTNEFVAIEQFGGDPSPELAAELDDVTPTGVTVAGTTWTVFDRSEIENPGNREIIYLLTGMTENGNLMVSGSASIDEIELAATRALESLGGTQ
ncbi:MAG: DUF4245 family protein [Microbacteriaceae bacterium]